MRTTEKQFREGHTSLEEIIQKADSYANGLDIEEEEYPTQVAGYFGPSWMCNRRRENIQGYVRTANG